MGKVILFNWTNVGLLPRWELNIFSMPSALHHNDPAWRSAACQALGIPSCHIEEDTHILQAEGTKFNLTPGRIPAERKKIAEERGADVVMDAGANSGSGDESGWSGVSDNSSTDSECTNLEASSVASDQDRFDAAYEEACIKLTPGSLQGVSPAKMHLVSSWKRDKRSCRNWSTCLAIGHWPG